jgi:hypothetical protein
MTRDSQVSYTFGVETDCVEVFRTLRKQARERREYLADARRKTRNFIASRIAGDRFQTKK